jgi:hypothetical protein
VKSWATAWTKALLEFTSLLFSPKELVNISKKEQVEVQVESENTGHLLVLLFLHIQSTCTTFCKVYVKY